jgi:hypothetical protein
VLKPSDDETAEAWISIEYAPYSRKPTGNRSAGYVRREAGRVAEGARNSTAGPIPARLARLDLLRPAGAGKCPPLLYRISRVSP